MANNNQAKVWQGADEVVEKYCNHLPSYDAANRQRFLEARKKEIRTLELIISACELRLPSNVRAYIADGNFSKAAQEFEKVQETYPPVLGTFAFLGVCYSAAGDLQPAAKYLDAAANASISYDNCKVKSIVHQKLASLYEQNGNWQRAIEAYQLALTFNEKNKAAIEGLSRCRQPSIHSDACLEWQAFVENLPSEEQRLGSFK